MVTLRQSLAGSLNVPTVKLANLIGVDAVIDAVGMESHGYAIDNMFDVVKQKVGMGADRASALKQAILAVRFGGKVSIPGVYGGMTDKWPLGAMMEKGLQIRGGQTHVRKYTKPLLEKIFGYDIELPEGLQATANVAEALEGADLVISALPAQATPHFIEKHRGDIPSNAIFCCTSKGLYLEEGCFLSEAMLRAFQRPQTLAFLSGPSFARQICERHPTALVCASAKLADAVQVQFALSSKRFRVYASQDTVGVELGGALKNPLAIGAGMIEGAGFGINTLAAFVTRATRELTVLCVAMGGRPETISGLAGVGDLMLTAFGDLSRNRNCGLRLAKGESLDTILQSCTVEGVPTASVAKAFATKCNLDLPLFTAVAMILDGRLQVEDALDHLMSRPLGTEVPLL